MYANGCIVWLFVGYYFINIEGGKVYNSVSARQLYEDWRVYGYKVRKSHNHPFYVDGSIPRKEVGKYIFPGKVTIAIIIIPIRIIIAVIHSVSRSTK